MKDSIQWVLNFFDRERDLLVFKKDLPFMTIDFARELTHSSRENPMLDAYPLSGKQVETLYQILGETPPSLDSLEVFLECHSL